jgi:hypothetical protein
MTIGSVWRFRARRARTWRRRRHMKLLPSLGLRESHGGQNNKQDRLTSRGWQPAKTSLVDSELDLAGATTHRSWVISDSEAGISRDEWQSDRVSATGGAFSRRRFGVVPDGDAGLSGARAGFGGWWLGQPTQDRHPTRSGDFPPDSRTDSLRQGPCRPRSFPVGPPFPPFDAATNKSAHPTAGHVLL